MKKSITLLAGLAAAAFSTQASAADLVIRVTGSTAYRSNFDTALTTGALGATYTRAASTVASSPSGANFHVYTTGTSPNKTTIKTSWSGSVAGVLALTAPATVVKFLPETASGTNLPETDAVSDAVSGNNQCDIGASDCYQAATLFKTPILTDKICGVVQFRVITNYGPGGVNPIKSINYQQIRALYQTGRLPLSAFTGNPTDTAPVFGLGRDPDSGTRVTFLAESGIGANSTVIHWQPTAGNGTTTGATTAVATLIPWPAESKFGLDFAEGNSGYPSGGNLAKAMRLDTSSVTYPDADGNPVTGPCYFITCTSAGDTKTATGESSGGAGAGNAKAIALENSDGQGTATDPTTGSASTYTAILNKAIRNGTHPLWSYFHVMHNGLTGTKLAFYNSMTTSLQQSTNDGISVGDGTVSFPGNMNVERQSDGGTITRK